MPVDAYFLGSTKPLKHVRVNQWLRNVPAFQNDPDRLSVVNWIAGMAAWNSSFDFTFGSGTWKGRRHGRRKEQRDGLLVAQRYSRGLDVDDALDLFRRFMHRVLPGKSWVAAIEPNRDQLLNPGHHGHGMFEAAGDVYFRSVHDAWLKENGFGKVNPIRNRVACECYATKHLVGRGKIFGYELYQRGVLDPHLEQSL